MVYTVYILRTSSNSLYTGQTNDLPKRLTEHKQKGNRSAKYMRGFTSFDLVYKETFATRGDALKREYQLKQLSKAQKEVIIAESGVSKKG